ncbi:putative gas vesicle synthesis protein [Actinacidiphila reveromycinica]|uniref:Putative gas vesicle synthesis protein n=1 Tax=Actinacidiphila reveromycinica TaxID=659352 RepID=A0A7U3VLC6_9ACTN|nr:gas vesicle protein GvpG [Streptomyces sp. SN-593]BBA95420.1 putative gas vesicle synthesis protein [Streptomyces sp. SN-593]
MGVFTGLLLLPLAPVRGVGWVSQVLLETAEKEMYDPAVLRARLAELHRALDDGEIDAARFEAEEERLLDELERRTPRRHSAAHESGDVR